MAGAGRAAGGRGGLGPGSVLGACRWASCLHCRARRGQAASVRGTDLNPPARALPASRLQRGSSGRPPLPAHWEVPTKPGAQVSSPQPGHAGARRGTAGWPPECGSLRAEVCSEGPRLPVISLSTVSVSVPAPAEAGQGQRSSAEKGQQVRRPSRLSRWERRAGKLWAGLRLGREPHLSRGRLDTLQGHRTGLTLRGGWRGKTAKVHRESHAPSPTVCCYGSSEVYKGTTFPRLPCFR